MNRQILGEGIDWLCHPDGRDGYTWNPVTGCLNGCEYCYARKIAERYKYKDSCFTYVDGIKPHHLRKVPYPYGFIPTLHPERLSEPAEKKKGANIFVCSMGDLFGQGVPDEWIERVFKAMRAAPQHNYLCLTRNIKRLWEAPGRYKFEDNWLLGTTATTSQELIRIPPFSRKRIFVSIEPILGKLVTPLLFFSQVDWIILGLMRVNGKVRKNEPFEWSWIEELVEIAHNTKTPVFMKDSLKGFVPELIQEIPEALKRQGYDDFQKILEKKKERAGSQPGERIIRTY